MKRIILILAAVLIGSIFTSSFAMAGSATNALISCLSDNTTGKDRKDMARWVFAGMSVHPEIKSLSNVTESDRDQLDKTIAALTTKLLADTCKEQAKLALEKEADQEPFKVAFGVIGKLAMQELMANSEVMSAFTSFAKYIDVKAFDSK